MTALFFEKIQVFSLKNRISLLKYVFLQKTEGRKHSFQGFSRFSFIFMCSEKNGRFSHFLAYKQPYFFPSQTPVFFRLFSLFSTLKKRFFRVSRYTDVFYEKSWHCFRGTRLYSSHGIYSVSLKT